ncbi:MULTISPECIES: DNA-processing protein DprA [Bartonella]|uniref:DNA-processing protein DprA n=1 Tax=Bartonella TaxID=773 RepID=UPI0018DE3330|nr:MULTISPECIES: DNA-processing protein DprA [Bartonella]MBH9975568.1 DNA-protecting protein DprA [Bartonella choladocola]MBI0015175.1 DNA-protecting protein DprA [Bartonella sp. B10834G3]
MEKRKGITLSDAQRLSWLQLIRSENVGAVTFINLIEHFGSASNALAALPELSIKGGKGKPIRIASRKDAEQELERAEKIGVRFVGVGEPDYPPYLRAAETPPPLVAIKGNCDCFFSPSVGVVGSRNASATGKKLTTLFCQKLGETGFKIISGLARGVDTAAHISSLETGTIAVMAGGIDHIYPPENNALYEKILEKGGAIISEMPIGALPRAQDFPRRNRIIAGLSLGVLVCEAAIRSGSLITARMAAEMGRIVFAIPGSPLDPRAQGTNNIIKEGALLVTRPEDIAETLLPLTTSNENQTSLFAPVDSIEETDQTKIDNTEARDIDANDRERDAIIDALSTTPIDIETLSNSSGVPIDKIYLILVELDLAGKLVRHSGGLVSLAFNDFPR